MKRSAHELSDDLVQSFRCCCTLGLHSCAAGEMKDDVQKLEFTIKALALEPKCSQFILLSVMCSHQL